MKRRTALEARLKRLEQRQFQKPFKLIIIANKDANESDVVGITNGNKLHIMRQAGEQLEAFERRSVAVSGARVLFRVYRTHGTAAEHPEAAPWQSDALEA